MKSAASWSTRTDIIKLQWENPEMTYRDIATASESTIDVVYRTLDPLFKMGVLERSPHEFSSRRPSLSAAI